MKLVIAEKPSVAMALASVLGARTRKDGYVEGNGYIVSWCVGHLVGLCDASEYDEKYKKWRYEDLPIVPECWKHKILEGTKKQFGILKKLMRDSKVDEVICATDAGREGELIFRLVYEQAGCQKPMKRLWISSMEEQAIKDGFASLKDGSCYDSLYQSALCRAKADWLVGINASRLFSVLYNQNLKVGRVQTPTLAMIVDRNQKIKEFTKEKYYMAHIKFDDMDAVTENFQKKEDADKVAAECQERMCEVEKDDVKEKTVRPPKLYDLTTLQREANRMFGYTAQQTLDAVQEMYEQKLVTYPRTDSQYLTDEMGESTETLIQMLLGKMPYAEGLEYQPDVSKVLNSKKWKSDIPLTDEKGKPLLRKNGKPMFRASYSILQDELFHYMTEQGFKGFQRGEYGSTAEHLTSLQYQIQQDKERLEKLQKRIQKEQVKYEPARHISKTLNEIDSMGQKTITGKMAISKEDYSQLTALAKEGITSRAEIKKFEQSANFYRQKYMDSANALERMKTKYNELKEKCRPFLEALEHFPEVAKLFTEKVKQLFSFKEAQERAEKEAREKERQERTKARRNKRDMER